MTRRQVRRRLVLGAVAVVLALPGLGAAAAVEGPFDYPSAEHFKGECEDSGGIFTDTGDGNLWCQSDGGAQTVCSTEGDDCYSIPYAPPKRPGPALGGAPTTQGAGTSSPLLVTAPGVGIVGSVRAQAHEQDHHASKRGKQGGHKGQRGRR